mmetsp:Transcript_107549/g.229641  ORF Transcript_107549/g.229641 Transcript_107549/m.229641 type:complete len:149 (-) Transcript_107549:466-912(-)
MSTGELPSPWWSTALDLLCARLMLAEPGMLPGGQAEDCRGVRVDGCECSGGGAEVTREARVDDCSGLAGGDNEGPRGVTIDDCSGSGGGDADGARGVQVDDCKDRIGAPVTTEIGVLFKLILGPLGPPAASAPHESEETTIFAESGCA